MKQTPKQSGFSAVILLLVLVIVGIIGGTGWYVWNRQQNTKTNNSGNAAAPVAPKESQNNEKSSVKYVTIKEWNVRAPYSGDAGFKYKIEGKYASFTSTKVASLGHGCTGEQEVGVITRFNANDKLEDSSAEVVTERPVEELAKQPGTGIAKVGEFYYGYTSPHYTDCGLEADSSVHQETVDTKLSINKELQGLVSKLEEVK